MEPITKSQFLDRLASAITRTHRLEIPKNHYPASYDRVSMAFGHTKYVGLFVDDPNHKAIMDNPVIQTVEWLSRLDESSAPKLNHLASIERAWEYLQTKF